MRILYVSADFGVPVLGFKGASVHVRELTDALVRQGHEVVIVTPNAGAGNEALARVIHAPAPVPPRPLSATLRAAGAPWGRGKQAEREAREIVYNATLRRVVAQLAAQWPPHLLYERYALFGMAGYGLSRELGVTHALEVNAPLRLERQRAQGLALEPVARWAERRIFGRADQVMCVSEAMASYVVAHGAGSRRVSVQPNGVDTVKFAVSGDAAAPRAALGFGDGDIVAGFVGSLKTWHGVEDLVQAFARARRELPALRLLIVGDGPARPSIEQAIDAGGVRDVVTLTGNIPHAEIPRYIAAMDLAVAPYLPSANFYFSPLKIFEYQAAGRAVIAPALGQIPDILRDGETGLLYPPGDTAALAARLTRLGTDARLRSALGERAAAYVRAHHSWDTVARRLVERVQPARARRRR